MKKYIVRAADEDFVVRDTFDSLEEATAHADKMSEIFGAWNVEIYVA